VTRQHKLPQYRQDRLEYIDTLEYLDNFVSGVNCRCERAKDGSPIDCERCNALELIREQLEAFSYGQ